MTIWPVWFHAYSIIASIFTTFVLFGFCIQTFIYKHNQRDELTSTYSILATIGLVKLLSSCASSYVFTCSIVTADVEVFHLLSHWLDIVRIIALCAQMLFLVWRLELTFIRTNYQLSNTCLILYHIIIVASIILHAILATGLLSYDMLVWFYYLAQLVRLGVFFSVAYQFMNKLFDLIANQHTSNTEYNTPKHAKLIKEAHKNHMNMHINSSQSKPNTKVNEQLLNELKDEVEMVMESQMDESAFTEKNYKLISIITKLSFLACIDFATLFGYVTFAEIYTIILYGNDYAYKFHMIFAFMAYGMEPLCFFIFSLTVWFSFTFADKQYLWLFGCCHRRFMKCFENRAKKRTIKKQVQSLPPRLSPIFNIPKEKSINSGELELEYSVMQS